MESIFFTAFYSELEKLGMVGLKGNVSPRARRKALIKAKRVRKAGFFEHARMEATKPLDEPASLRRKVHGIYPSQIQAAKERARLEKNPKRMAYLNYAEGQNLPERAAKGKI